MGHANSPAFPPAKNSIDWPRTTLKQLAGRGWNELELLLVARKVVASAHIPPSTLVVVAAGLLLSSRACENFLEGPEGQKRARATSARETSAFRMD